MIDREARDRAAILVQDFWTGRITNRALEAAWPDSEDRGVLAVAVYVDLFSDDFEEHFIDKETAARAEASAIIMNCIAFLKSKELYSWLRFSVLSNAEQYPRWAVVASFGLLGLWNGLARTREARYWQEMHAHGDVDAWPFRCKGIS
jgi:hypothetical protein